MSNTKASGHAAPSTTAHAAPASSASHGGSAAGAQGARGTHSPDAGAEGPVLRPRSAHPGAVYAGAPIKPLEAGETKGGKKLMLRSNVDLRRGDEIVRVEPGVHAASAFSAEERQEFERLQVLGELPDAKGDEDEK